MYVKYLVWTQPKSISKRKAVINIVKLRGKKHYMEKWDSKLQPNAYFVKRKV